MNLDQSGTIFKNVWLSYDGRIRGGVEQGPPAAPKSNNSNGKARPMHELSSNTTDDLDHEWPFSDDEDGSDESLDREEQILQGREGGKVLAKKLCESSKMHDRILCWVLSVLPPTEQCASV